LKGKKLHSFEKAAILRNEVHRESHNLDRRIDIFLPALALLLIGVEQITVPSNVP
jgi:hypothetical protein